MNLYVGNLPYSLSDQELEGMFAAFGEVKSAKIIFDRSTNRSKGFGFVEMGSSSEGQEAIDQLNGKDLNGRPMRVNEARPKVK